MVTWQPGDKIVAFPRFLSKSEVVFGFGMVGYGPVYIAQGVTKGVFNKIVASDRGVKVNRVNTQRKETGSEKDITLAKSHHGKIVKYNSQGVMMVLDPAEFYYENVRGLKKLKREGVRGQFKEADY